NAILLPYVMEYNLPFAEYKYARIARAMGIVEKNDHEAAVKGIEHIKELSEEIGLPGIRTLNVNPADFELLAEMSVMNGSNDSNPRKITQDEYVMLLKKAYDDSSFK
ncbi:MAG: NAD-dependent alcohol dehydrogenase, partial [Lutispora sp.]